VRALKYFFGEAFASLWRGRRAAAFSIVTIAAGLFVLGFFLLVNANVQRLVASWTQSAELAVYLRDDATDEQVAALREMIGRGGMADSVDYVSKDDARKQFERDFPDLASAASGLDRNPFPASLEVRLNSRAQEAAPAVDAMGQGLAGMPGVADVRYDRRWLARLGAVVRVIRGIGLAIVVLLAFASALTVANVVRLAAAARSNEIDIMRLVGAPFAYIRGPFIIEGLLQGGFGALCAVGLLAATFALVRDRLGAAAADAVGLAGVSFVPVELLLLLVVGGMALGCLGGYIVARGVR
jgi:cell division transport system permease protein